MKRIVGIDCATQESRTGLCLALVEGPRLFVREAVGCRKDRSCVDVVRHWLDEEPSTLLALDAPLGWPFSLAEALAGHRAGCLPAVAPARWNSLFRRATDESIERRFHKRPLEVGASFIARTAYATLRMLEAIRAGPPRRTIPLAWSPDDVGPAAVEVYPAVTRLAHGLPSREAFRNLRWLALECPIPFSPHAQDAILCAVAGCDFLRSACLAPSEVEREMAEREGWIWAR